jgi:hypothetical protein
MNFIGIDPGKQGSFVYKRKGLWTFCDMPLSTNLVCFEKCIETLGNFAGKPHVILEWAIPMMMGRKHAFNYGVDFSTLVCAIKTVGLPYTLVHPKTWQKVMHQGVHSKLHPKERSALALQRLAPDFYRTIPVDKKGKPNDGVVDAALLCLWGEHFYSGTPGG